MYGLLLENLQSLIVERYGEGAWRKISEKAHASHIDFSTKQSYSEDLLFRIVKEAEHITGESRERLMEETGFTFIKFIQRYGYDRILKVLGRHMRDFLNSLDNLHEFVRFSFPKLKAPSFFCDDETDSGLKLHYRSSRKGFLHYVSGQIKSVGRLFYNLDVEIEVINYTENKEGSYALFQLNFDNKAFSTMLKRPKRHSIISLGSDHCTDDGLEIDAEVLNEVFPFHIVFDRDMKISCVGKSIDNVLQTLPGTKIGSSFALVRPYMEFSWQNICLHTNVIFELQAVEPVQQRAMAKYRHGDVMPFARGLVGEHTTAIQKSYIHLKGQMCYVAEWQAMVFLASPMIESLQAMCSLGLYFNDLSLHDSSRDLVLAGTQQSAELKLALDQELQKSIKLEESMMELENEKKRTDSLLYQMIPKSVADRLRLGKQTMDTCKTFSDVTILFSDVVGFTNICSMIQPMEVVTMLNNMYTSFDSISERHNVYKVETIGDAYMVVSGVPEQSMYHAEHVADLALNLLDAMHKLPDPSGASEHLKIRIGIHTGMVVAGVVGLKMPRYCLFGDAVNTASMMESTGMVMSVHVSEATREQLINASFVLKQRGTMDIRGKSGMKTYWLMGRKTAKADYVMQSMTSCRTGDSSASSPVTNRASGRKANEKRPPRGNYSSHPERHTAEIEGCPGTYDEHALPGESEGHPGGSQRKSMDYLTTRLCNLL